MMVTYRREQNNGLFRYVLSELHGFCETEREEADTDGYSGTLISSLYATHQTWPIIKTSGI